MKYLTDQFQLGFYCCIRFNWVIFCKR